MICVHWIVRALPLMGLAFISLAVNLDLAESKMRVCFFGLVSKPDSDQRLGWVTPVIESIRIACRRAGGTQSPKPVLMTSRPLGGCTVDSDGPLGMETGGIADENINASSIRESGDEPYTAARARLNTAGYPWCWCAANDDVKPWIQVAFNQRVYVTGLQIQGNGVHEFWVTMFYTMYSDDGISWQNVTDKEFTGNTDTASVVTALFAEVLYTSFIRIAPTDWFDRCCLRFEVLGCY